MENKISEILTEEALYESMCKCLKGVTWKDSVAHFQQNWATEIKKLANEIENDTYKQRKPYYFYVGKRRIMSISFRDRVVQRCINDTVLYPNIVPILTYGNSACQKGKGTTFSCDYLKRLIRREWRHHGDNLFALKCDIKGYYDNVPHSVGEYEIQRTNNNEVFKFIKDKVLAVYPGNTGYIAGNQTVQIIGISALNRLDHYIKERLQAKNYIRYMDDFIIVSHDIQYLRFCKQKIESKIKNYGMELHKTKTTIVSIKENGIDFLGYNFRISANGKVYVSIASHKTKRKRIELARMANKVKRGEKSRESADKAYMDYRSHVLYGDTEQFLKRMDKFYFGLYEEDVPIYVKNQRRSKKRKRN